MADHETRKITVVVPQELHRELKLLSVEQHTFIQELVLDAIKSLVSENTGQSASKSGTTIKVGQGQIVSKTERPPLALPPENCQHPNQRPGNTRCSICGERL